jgi:hypothetical protein
MKLAMERGEGGKKEITSQSKDSILCVDDSCVDSESGLR